VLCVTSRVDDPPQTLDLEWVVFVNALLKGILDKLCDPVRAERHPVDISKPSMPVSVVSFKNTKYGPP
jgi:hypothetical protein